MGMYDTIYCRRPLPDDWTSDHDFQTKNLHKLLCVYEIGTDGRLRELAIDDCGQPIPEKSHDTGFHGVIHFYTLVGDDRREYEAKFTDGSLVWIHAQANALYDDHGMHRDRKDTE